jgi:hypothetical protein
MAFGFPAYFEASIHYSGSPNQIPDAVRQALNTLGWHFLELKPNQWQAKVGLNLYSWGEKFLVDDQENGNLKVKSNCIFPLQCIDWGKNRRNVRRFEMILSAQRNH